MSYGEKAILPATLFCLILAPICLGGGERVLLGREMVRTARQISSEQGPVTQEGESRGNRGEYKSREVVDGNVSSTGESRVNQRKITAHADSIRILQFPEDCSVGRVYFRERDVPMDWHNSFRDWGRWLEAAGKINVPPGKAVRFDPYKVAWRGGWALSTLKEDDIQFLTFLWYRDADDSVMRDIGRLTGLQNLALGYCDGIETGVKYLTGLKKLRHLWMPGGMKTEDLVYLAELGSLKSLTFGGPEVTDNKMIHIGKLTQLTQLSMGDSEVAEGLMYLKGFKSLRFLNLQSNRRDDIDDGLRHIAGLTKLEELNLRETAVSDAGLAHLGGLAKLKKLNLLMNRGGVSDAGIAHLTNLKSLEELVFPNNDIGDTGLAYLSEMDSLRNINAGRNVTDKGLATVSKMKSLESLQINSKKVTDSGLTELSGCVHLKSLRIAGSAITDEGLAKLAEIGSLRNLGINGTTITGTGLGKLKHLHILELDRAANVTGDGLAGLKELPLLTKLMLDRMNLDKTGTGHLGGLTRLTRLTIRYPNMKFGDEALGNLAGLASLKYLNILVGDASLSAITDQGLVHLSDLKALEYLRLDPCPRVTDAGLKHLEGMLELKELTLAQSRITLEGVARLKEKIPKVVATAPCTMGEWNRKQKAIERGQPFAGRGASYR